MRRTLLLLLLVVAITIPSAAYLWSNSDLPGFCSWHDDCVYFVTAKSIAQQGEYRIESLPGEPTQTKYPPLYPVLLSLAWLLTPQFPANLHAAAWISWAVLPVMLFCLGLYYRKMGLGDKRAWFLLACIAVNPYTMMTSYTLLSEPLFMALMFGALLLSERSSSEGGSVKWAAASGIVMGLAYLTRTAGIVALLTVPLFFLMRKQKRPAVAFAAGMLPFVLSWTAWTQFHKTVTPDPAWMYYVDYGSYQSYNVPLQDLPLVIWKNIDSMMWAIGALVFPKAFSSLFLKIVTQVLAVASIAGVVRMVRRGQWVNYSLFALGSLLVLTIWHFPADERFVYPLFPLTFAGLLVEMEHLWGMLKSGLHHVQRSQRVVAAMMLGAVGLTLLGAVGLQAVLDLLFIPTDAQERRVKRETRELAFAWLKEKTPESALILAARDPMVYLYTGRHALSRQVPPKYWYHDDRAAILESFRTLPPFARQHELAYMYYEGVDIVWVLGSAEQEALDRVRIDDTIRSHKELGELFREEDVTVFKVSPENLVGASNAAPDGGVDQAAHQHNQ